MKPDSVKDLYLAIRKAFPVCVHQADIDHERKGFEEDDEAYSLWFESFACATNDAMNSSENNEVADIFVLVSNFYENSGPSVKKCLDSSYVENLFWKCSKEDINNYWDLLPNNLKSLYISFHGGKP